MGIPVLILGASGSGKSASMRNFDEDEIEIFNVASKPLPFRKKLKTINKAGYGAIVTNLQKNRCKKYVIDDSQYLMAFDMFAKAKEKGYDKFTDIAVNFYNLLKWVTDGTPEDTVVYFLHHTERNDDGKVKAKTSGKMLDQQLTVEGLFSIVLLAQTSDGEYYFETQSDGFTPCKSPMEMFDFKIDNDLKFVDRTIRDYYGFTEENKIENNLNKEEKIS